MKNSVFFAAFLLFCNSNLIAQNLQTLFDSHERAIAYLNNHQDSAEYNYNLRLLTKYIANQYNFDKELNVQLLNYTPRTEDDQEVYTFYRPLIGVFLTDFMRDSLQRVYKKTTEYRHLLLWAFYPDQLSWDSICEQLWKESLTSGEHIRGISHTALAYHISKYKIQKGNNDIILMADILLPKIAVSKPYTDDGMEGILGLILLDHPEKIKLSWINEIMRKQQLDGGWKWDNKAPNSNPHTTVLALWILSEWKKKTDRLKLDFGE